MQRITIPGDTPTCSFFHKRPTLPLREIEKRGNFHFFLPVVMSQTTEFFIPVVFPWFETPFPMLTMWHVDLWYAHNSCAYQRTFTTFKHRTQVPFMTDVLRTCALSRGRKLKTAVWKRLDSVTPQQRTWFNTSGGCCFIQHVDLGTGPPHGAHSPGNIHVSLQLLYTVPLGMAYRSWVFFSFGTRTICARTKKTHTQDSHNKLCNDFYKKTSFQ